MSSTGSIAKVAVEVIPSSILLLFLFIAVSLAGDVFSCDVKRLIKGNKLVKLLVVYLTAFFFITVVDNDAKEVHPLYLALFALIITFAYLIATQTEGVGFLMILIILGIHHFVRIWVSYEENIDPEMVDQTIYTLYLFVSLFILSLIAFASFVVEFRKQRRFASKNGKSFRIKDFILGTTYCEK